MPNSTQPRQASQRGYRLYTMDRDGHIVDVRAFEASGDSAGMVVAAECGDGELHELWCGDRQITEFSAVRANKYGGVEAIEAAGGDHASPRELESGAVRSLDPELIRRVQSARRARSAFLPTGLFADPAWDMLLELFACELEQRRLSVGSLSAASGVPATTSLRWIQSLEHRRLTCRENDSHDGRRQWITLSSVGSAAMRRYFATVPYAVLAL